MKRFLALLSLVLLTALIPSACSNNPYSPAAVHTATISTTGSFTYSSTGPSGSGLTAPITLSAPATVTWDSSNGGIHPLMLDDGASTCILNGQSSPPTYPYVHVFNSAGDYKFHCANHGSGCTPGSCPANCTTGMHGTIHVQ